MVLIGHRRLRITEMVSERADDILKRFSWVIFELLIDAKINRLISIHHSQVSEDPLTVKIDHLKVFIDYLLIFCS